MTAAPLSWLGIVRLRGIRIKDLRRGGSLAREAAGHMAHEAVEPVHSPA